MTRRNRIASALVTYSLLGWSKAEGSGGQSRNKGRRRVRDQCRPRSARGLVTGVLGIRIESLVGAILRYDAPGHPPMVLWSARMWFVATLIAALLLSWQARGADHLAFAAPDSWVTPVSVPPVHVRDARRSVQMLLLTIQDRYEPDGRDTFIEMATHVQTGQGLSDLGDVELGWNPQTEMPVVHRLTILRDGHVIDVLATQKFTVLRRETNLENAMLDGELTAVLQPEGLRVGDVVDFAYTVRFRDPVLQGHSESLFRNALLLRPNHLAIRETWQAGHDVRWQSGEGFAAPQVSTGPAGTRFSIDMDEVEPPELPRGAPGRFGFARELDLTDFKDWTSIADLFRPIYDRASKLSSDSPLAAELARISASSPDPAQRAMRALQLVQERIRYVYLGANDGSYLPAAAELTWSRRFGDCKGKTVLLLALLHGLGIEAVPALVSTTDGDGLDERLPTLGRFDHVLVRATIAGRVYWLDGTRFGDRTLERLPMPPFGWALPLAAHGARPERLAVASLAEPEVDTTLRADATAGLFSPAQIHGEMLLRGETAAAFRLAAAATAPDAMQAGLRQAWRHLDNSIDPTEVGFTLDDATGQARITMQGRMRLDWTVNSGDGGRDLSLDAGSFEITPDFDRRPGPHADAPFVVAFPHFRVLREDIVLPSKGSDLRLLGRDIDRQTAIAHWQRKARITEGVLHLTLSEQTLTPEVPAKETADIAAIFRRLSAGLPFLHVRKDATWTERDYAVRDALALSDPDELLERARHRWAKHALDGALADLDRAVASAPTSAEMLAYRGNLQLERGMRDRATADFDAAAALDANEPTIWFGRGRLAVLQGRFADAVGAFTHVLSSNSGSDRAFAQRAWAYAMLRDPGHALEDYAAAIRLAPDNIAYRSGRWNLLLAEKQAPQALQEVDAFAAQQPRQAWVLLARAVVLRTLGRNTEAVADCEAAVAIQPTPGAYVELFRNRPATDTQRKSDDLDSALRLDPHFVPALVARGALQMISPDHAKAAAYYSQAVLSAPKDSWLLGSATRAFESLGRHDLALLTLDRLVALQPANPKWLNERCWIRATSGGDSHTSLADCDAAVKLDASFPEALDSRGFVNLRLHQFDAARQDYDAALKIRPDTATSLFGRAVALGEAGDRSAAQRDLAAARALDPHIETAFAGYGIHLAASGDAKRSAPIGPATVKPPAGPPTAREASTAGASPAK